MTAGQGIGSIFGAIIGTIIAPGAGTLIGAGIGGTAGGLVLPAQADQPKAQFETQEIQYNTFQHDLPVPVLFGTKKWAPNTIFIGDTFSRVEVVGTQTVAGTGLSAGDQQQNVEKLIYYADFAFGLGEGPFRGVSQVFREAEDISGQEGTFFKISLGPPGEAIPDIVINAPNPIERPVPWMHTAKILCSGRLGEANRIPRFQVIATGHDLTVRSAGPNLESIGSNVLSLYHDDLSDLLTFVTGNYTIVTVSREGGDKETATIPQVSANRAEIAAYDGRTATLLVISRADSDGTRRIFRGERDWDDLHDWEISIGTAEAFRYSIDGWTVDDSLGVLWTIHVSVTGMVLVGTSFHDGTQQAVQIPTGDTAVDVRAVWYDKSYQRFYVLYTTGSELKLLRFSPTDTADRDEMLVGYGFSDPIGVCRVGELICIFDRAKPQPLHLFEWGRSVDRFAFGTLSNVLDFDPRYISGLRMHYKADSISGISTGGAVAGWNDSSGHGHTASKGATTDQPTYRATVSSFYNRPAVEFDGVNDDFDTFANSPALDSSNGVTLFFVIRPLGSPTALGNRIFSMRNQPSPTPPGNTVYWADVGWGHATLLSGATSSQVDGYVWFASTGGSYVGAPVSQGEAAIIAIRFKQGEVTLWKNGILQSTYTSTTGFGPLALVNDVVFTIGRWVGNVGSAESGHCNVQIAEIMTYERDLSLTEVESANDYLRAKYRINWGPSYGIYQGAGDKLVYGNPQKFCFTDGLSRMIVLDQQTAGTWALYHHQWNGDGWSVLRDDEYEHAMFDEEATPAGAMWSFLGSDRYGAGIKETFLNRYTFERTSGFCSQPVDIRFYQNDPVTYGARYHLDYLMAARKNLQSTLQEMTTTFNGFLVMNEGKLELHAERDLGYIDGYYDEDTIIEGSFGHQGLAREDHWNQIIVEAYDERNDFRRVPVPATAEWEKDLYGEVRRKTISGVGINRLRQAGNIAWTALLAFTTRREACQFKTAAMGLRQVVGDIVAVSRDGLWDKKLFRVVRMEESESEDIVLQCIEHIPHVSEANGFPLQDPQRASDLNFPGTGGNGSNFAPVNEGVRERAIENTITGEVWLFASRPDNSGPWASMRWHAIWDSSPTPGATFYPGTIPLVSTAYTLLTTTQHFSPSGLLKSTITANATSIEIVGVCGTPPEQNFDIVLYNEAITTGQFNNPHGNGKYEHIQGASYNTGSKIITAQARGIGTAALAHTVQAVPVGALYTRRISDGLEDGEDDNQPIPIYWKNQVIPTQVHGSHPLDTPGDEWYIGFDASDFTAATPNGVNNLRVVVSSNSNLTASINDFKPVFEYSLGGGVWKLLKVHRDETNGFRQSGAICFDVPTDWVVSDRWKPSGPSTQEFFPSFNGSGTATARYYIRVTRVSLTKNPPGSTQIFSGSPHTQSAASRDVALEGQTSNAAKGYNSPTVYFLVASATPRYDFISAETGFGLKFRAQPVGMQSQSIPLDNLTEIVHPIQNLAGE